MFLSGLRLGRAITGFLPTGGPDGDVSPEGPSPACEVRAVYDARGGIARENPLP
jgi:hypothetical protein